MNFADFSVNCQPFQSHEIVGGIVYCHLVMRRLFAMFEQADEKSNDGFILLLEDDI